MKVSVRLFACLVSTVIAVQAQNQNLFVLPGTGTNAGNVATYSPQPFAPGPGYVAGNASFLVLAKPDGSKYYTIASAGAQTVTVTDSGFGNSRSLGNLGTQATNAVLTPDGSRLYVAAGTLQVFETAGDSNVGNITPGSFVTIFDLAMSLDGSKVFTLGSVSSGGSQLNSVNVGSNSIFGTLAIPGQATGVAVGLDGLVYVTTQNLILQIDPNTLTVTPGGTVQLNARPGRPVFTTDGKYLVAANQTPITGSSVLFIDLTSRALAGTISNQNIVLDKLYVVNSSTIYAYSTANQSLYTISIATGPAFVLNPNPYAVPGTNVGPVSSVVLSNEVAGGGRTTPQYLFLVQSGTLYRVDLTNNGVSQFPLSTSNLGGALSFAGGAFSGQPIALLQYGNGQVLAPNGTSYPLVVRALDQTGHALSGVTVTWTTNVATASVNPASSTTGADGYALTYLTAPPTNGIVTVSAVAGNQGVGFSIGVGTGTGGSAGALNIVAGQGQLTTENKNTGISGFGSPLIVQALDVNGKPVAGASVTFTITQGPGSITQCGLATLSTDGCTGTGQGSVAPNTVVVTTDANGQGAVAFLSSNIVPNGLGYTQTVITASSPGTNSRDFYITTTLQNAPQPTVQLFKPNFGDTITGQAGTVQAGAVIVKASSPLGAPIPNIGVIVSNGGLDPGTYPSATCVDSTGNGVLTDATGTATCDLKFGGRTGTIGENAYVGYANILPTFTVRVTNGPPGNLSMVQGNNQSGKPGQTLPLAFVVQVQDGFGNILTNVPVTWQVLTPGAITLTNVSSSSDASGRASALGTLGSIAGTAQVKVTAGTVSAIFGATVTIPASNLLKVSGDGQTTLRSSQFSNPLVVKVVDTSGNGIAGLPVAFAVTSGSATVQTTTATTDSSGQASTLVTAGSSAGSIVVTATYSTFSTTFNLTSSLPGPQNITVVNGASFLPGISPGSIALISGSGILPGVQGTFVSNQIIGPLPTSFPIPSSVGTGSVAFNNILAPVYYVSNAGGQELIAVQVPFEIQPGTVTLTINAVGGGTATTSVTVSALAPGVFETIYGGQKFASAVHADGTPISPSSPARRGENIRIYATGMGQVKPATVTNAVGQTNQPVNAPVIVGLNNGGVPLIAAEYAPGLVGVYVITLTVPSNTQTGPYQPIGLIAQGATGNLVFAQGTFIPIQ